MEALLKDFINNARLKFKMSWLKISTTFFVIFFSANEKAKF